MVLTLYAFQYCLLVLTSNSFSLPIFYLVYDVTRRETFTNLIDIWAKEVERYSTNHGSIKILVGNKVDKVNFIVNGLLLSLLRKRQTETIHIMLSFFHTNWFWSNNFFHNIIFLLFIVWILKTVSCITFQESERAVSKEEGMALAQQHRCLFLECSAKTRENVQQCFNDLTLKVYMILLHFWCSSCFLVLCFSNIPFVILCV